MLAQLWTKHLCISNHNKSMKKLLFFFIPLFLLSPMVLATAWTSDPNQIGSSNSIGSNITISTINISAVNSTFKIDCAGGTAGYDILIYLDGVLDYYTDDWASCEGYYWHTGLNVGYHVVYIQARDQDGVCIDGVAIDGVTYCDNDKYGNMLAFGVNPIGSIKPFNISLTNNNINRWSSAGVVYSNIYGGVPPYTMTFKAYTPNNLRTLSTWYLSTDNQTVYPVLYGSDFSSQANDVNYSIITVVTDSAGNSRDYGNYIPDQALVRLNVIGIGTELYKVNYTKKENCGNTIINPPLTCSNSASAEILLNLTLNGSSPYNVSIGYYNASASGSPFYNRIPLCTWINTYNSNPQITVIAPFGLWYWSMIAINDYNAIAYADTSFGNDIKYLPPLIPQPTTGANPILCYANDPTIFKVKGCEETGGQLNKIWKSNDIIDTNFTSFVTKFTGYNIQCGDYIYNTSVYYNTTLGINNPGVYVYPNGSIRSVIGNLSDPLNPEISWSGGNLTACEIQNSASGDINLGGGIKLSLVLIVLLVGIGIFAEIKTKSGGIVMGIILIVGLILLAYYNIISAWIPIICGIMIALIVAFFSRKLIKGG